MTKTVKNVAGPGNKLAVQTVVAWENVQQSYNQKVSIEALLAQPTLNQQQINGLKENFRILMEQTFPMEL
jgi:hypothetical protein